MNAALLVAGGAVLVNALGKKGNEVIADAEEAVTKYLSLRNLALKEILLVKANHTSVTGDVVGLYQDTDRMVARDQLTKEARGAGVLLSNFSSAGEDYSLIITRGLSLIHI